MQKFVIPALAVACSAAAVITGPAPASAAEQVAGRPALPTASTEELFKMREGWGSKPSGRSDQSSASKSETGKK